MTRLTQWLVALGCAAMVGVSGCGKKSQPVEKKAEHPVAAAGLSEEPVRMLVDGQEQTGEPAPPVTVPELLARINEVKNDTNALIETVNMIGEVDTGSVAVLTAFCGLLRHPEPGVRQAVLDSAFGFDAREPMIGAIAACLNDPLEVVRSDAGDLIGDIEAKEAIDVLVQNLTNAYVDVRENSDSYLFFHTGETFSNATEWFSWWATNRTTFTFE